MPRILVVKTSSLGDVIHNLPVVTDIHAHVPDAEIDWVVEERFAEVPALHPGVARVIPVAVRRWRARPFVPGTWLEVRDFRRRLQAHPYDVVLDTQGLMKSALLARMACGSVHGQDRATAREALAARLYRYTYHVPRGRHAVTRNRDLAAQVLGYRLPATPPDYGLRAPEELPPVALPERFVVALHASSREPKLWPEADWIALGRSLAGHRVALLLPWGSAKEERRARSIAAAVTGAVVLPALGLRELAAIFGRAEAVIGVDTGLVHLAAALARPTVAIYTDTSPLLTGVLAADASRARNLGERGRTPAPGDVYGVLREFGVVP
jgi:heptosyltransferase-1